MAWLNGKRVGDMVLATGSFTADKHLGAQTYDVTALVRGGENQMLIALGDGWTGDMGVFIETGLTLMDCYPVVEKWLAECRLNQYPDGRMANIAPSSKPQTMRQLSPLSLISTMPML